MYLNQLWDDLLQYNFLKIIITAVKNDTEYIK